MGASNDGFRIEIPALCQLIEVSHCTHYSKKHIGTYNGFTKRRGRSDRRPATFEVSDTVHEAVVERVDKSACEDDAAACRVDPEQPETPEGVARGEDNAGRADSEGKVVGAAGCEDDERDWMETEIAGVA
jgi:hypothetical protein